MSQNRYYYVDNCLTTPPRFMKIRQAITTPLTRGSLKMASLRLCSSQRMEGRLRPQGLVKVSAIKSKMMSELRKLK